jgi:acyl carrier protein
MDTRDTLLEIFRKLKFDPDDIDDSVGLRADLGVDSTELAEIAVAVEQQFSIVVEDDELHKLETFGDMVKYIESIRYQM